MEITLDGSRFDYRTCYQEEPGLRESFNALAGKVFGLDFEPWHRAGYWTDRYRPNSLVYEGRVVANVSVSPMDLRCMGKELHYLQIGTVMCDPEFRGRGLIHFLMARVLTDWAGKCHGIYLFANRDTQEFYPRFGFEKVREFRHTAQVQALPGRSQVCRLIPELSQDKSLILSHYQKGNPHALLSWEHNPGLLFFHCGGVMREHIYYVGSHDTVAVVEYDGETMYCHDLFGGSGRDLGEILSALARPETEKAVLGFTPRAGASCSVRPLMDRDSTLFMLGNGKEVLKRYSCRFPLLSHT